MTTPSHFDYLDEQNILLWEFVNKHYEISLEYTESKIHSVYSINKIAVIYIPYNNYSKSSFTHELLHLDLKITTGSIGGCLANSFKYDTTLSEAYSSELIDHLANCLEHVKMLPKFMKLGYPREEFINDYHVPKSNLAAIKKILLDFKVIGHWTTSLNLYLGRYFSIKACPDPDRSYWFSLFMLKCINKSLYKILDSFWLSWLAFEVDNRNHDFHDIFYKFTRDLSSWANINSAQ